MSNFLSPWNIPDPRNRADSIFEQLAEKHRRLALEQKSLWFAQTEKSKPKIVKRAKRQGYSKKAVIMSERDVKVRAISDDSHVCFNKPKAKYTRRSRRLFKQYEN